MPVGTGAAVVGGSNVGYGSVGVMALLGGWFGGVGADVIMVILSAMAGCFISLSANKTTAWESAKLMVTGIIVSLCLAWALSSLVISFMPSLESPYTPSLIAMMIGFMANRLEPLLNRVANKVEDKVKMITFAFIIGSLILILIGGYISSRLCDKQYNKWTRYIVLSPALVSMFTLFCLADGTYTPYIPDLVEVFMEITMYLFVAKHLQAFADYKNRRSSDRA